MIYLLKPIICTYLNKKYFRFFICNRYGARGRELVHSVGKVMLQGGGTFGTFMAIGTGIRC